MPELPNFRNTALLRLALTHHSYRNEYGGLEDNERLVFLGNAVLSFLSSAFLYKLYPEMTKGQLTRRRSTLVNEKHLAKFAIELGLGERIQNCTDAVQEQEYQNTKLLSSTFAAIIGAYFLDSGIDAVRTFVKPLFASVVERIPTSQPNLDSKRWFKQWSLMNFGQNPVYFILEESGPDDIKQFTAGACVAGEVYGVGTGRTKRAAEKLAAAAALQKLGLVF